MINICLFSQLFENSRLVQAALISVCTCELLQKNEGGHVIELNGYSFILESVN